jgi:hypothetical protein
MSTIDQNACNLIQGNTICQQINHKNAGSDKLNATSLVNECTKMEVINLNPKQAYRSLLNTSAVKIFGAYFGERSLNFSMKKCSSSPAVFKMMTL